MRAIFRFANGVRSILTLCENSASRYRSYRDEASFLSGIRLLNYGDSGSNSLDLGCGIMPKNPFNCSNVKGIDIAGSEARSNIITANLFTESIPFESDSFDYVTAYDFIEHVPRFALDNKLLRYPFIDLVSEIHRVLAPKGLFYSHTPAFPFKQAFQDPTHLNIITEDTFPYYFCLNKYNTHPWATAYGFCGSFKLVKQGWCRSKLLTILEKTDLPACQFSGL